MPNTYKPQQIQTADRMMNAIAKIPEKKQPLYTAMMECLLLGADMAQMGTESIPPLPDTGQSAVRPSVYAGPQKESRPAGGGKETTK